MNFIMTSFETERVAGGPSRFGDKRQGSLSISSPFGPQGTLLLSSDETISDNRLSLANIPRRNEFKFIKEKASTEFTCKSCSADCEMIGSPSFIGNNQKRMPCTHSERTTQVPNSFTPSQEEDDHGDLVEIPVETMTEEIEDNDNDDPSRSSLLEVVEEDMVAMDANGEEEEKPRCGLVKIRLGRPPPRVKGCNETARHMESSNMMTGETISISLNNGQTPTRQSRLNKLEQCLNGDNESEDRNRPSTLHSVESKGIQSRISKKKTKNYSSEYSRIDTIVDYAEAARNTPYLREFVAERAEQQKQRDQKALLDSKHLPPSGHLLDALISPHSGQLQYMADCSPSGRFIIVNNPKTTPNRPAII